MDPGINPSDYAKLQGDTIAICSIVTCSDVVKACHKAGK